MEALKTKSTRDDFSRSTQGTNRKKQAAFSETFAALLRALQEKSMTFYRLRESS
jgi:hypothetical protein